MDFARIVQGRRTAYATCASRFSAAATQDAIYGDGKCAEVNNARATAYWWAQDVMVRTAVGRENCECQCVTQEFACEVISLMDPACVECACGDRPATCAITQNYTVYQAADADQQTVLPNVAGRTTLILSNNNGSFNEWAQHVGEIATNDGAGNFTYTVPSSGQIILDDSGNDYYIAFSGGVGPLYPVINGSLVGTTLTLISEAPQVNAIAGREIVIAVSEDGVTWTGIYNGLESALEDPLVVTVTGQPTEVRSFYIYGELECQSVPNDGTITVDGNPPATARSYQLPPGSSIEGTDAAFTFAPWYEPRYRLSFWMKFDEAVIATSPYEEVGVSVYTSYISFPAFFLNYTQIFVQRSPLYNNAISFNLECTTETVTNTRIYTTQSIPGFDPSQWHNIRLVKEALTVATRNQLPDFTLYVDGVEVPLEVISEIDGGANPAIPWESGTVGLYRRTAVSTKDAFIDEVYMDTRPDTDGNAVLLTNLMEQAYAPNSWVFWYRAEVPDDLTAPPYSTPNAPNAPYLQAFSGTPSLSNDTPPQLP